ncbi:MAG: hypothetical protein FWG94_08290 [Oscillospiraceae bacterium]|nr:hypothetical protein [Oscillospiraceae bacterium]
MFPGVADNHKLIVKQINLADKRVYKRSAVSQVVHIAMPELFKEKPHLFKRKVRSEYLFFRKLCFEVCPLRLPFLNLRRDNVHNFPAFNGLYEVICRRFVFLDLPIYALDGIGIAFFLA